MPEPILLEAAEADKVHAWLSALSSALYGSHCIWEASGTIWPASICNHLHVLLNRPSAQSCTAS